MAAQRPAAGPFEPAAAQAVAPGSDDYDADYFAANYRDYAAQNPAWKLRFYRSVIERLAPRPVEDERRRLLDIGCGLGRFLAHMAAAGTGPSSELPSAAPSRAPFELAGTDLSRHAVEHDRERWPALTFVHASATDRPFPTDGFPHADFHVVTAFDVVEHVPDLAAVGEAVEAQLLPGGLFVFVVPVYDGLSGPIIRRLDRDPTHVHKNPRAFWLRWAEERFELVEWWGVLRYLLPGGLYLHWPTRLGRGHTPAILVAARKRS